jgi:acyl-CoA thioesterase-1
LNLESRIILLLLFLGVVYIGVQVLKPDRVRNTPPPSGPVVALGDSLTHGVGAADGFGYVDLLSKLLGQPIINRGNSGDTIEEASRRVKDEVLAHNPGIVIVLLGGNDMLQRRDLDESFKILEEIVTRIQDNGSMVLLVGLQGLSPIGKVKGHYKDLARKKQCLFVPDILDGIFSKPGLMSDSIHPNAEGYRIMAERIYRALESHQ